MPVVLFGQKRRRAVAGLALVAIWWWCWMVVVLDGGSGRFAAADRIGQADWPTPSPAERRKLLRDALRLSLWRATGSTGAWLVPEIAALTGMPALWPLVGALFGFLLWNWSPAQVFMVQFLLV